MIDKEKYERLKPYFIHLRRGYKGGYVYGLLQKDFDILYEIYQQLGGNARLKYTCNSCNLQLLKFLGKLYFEYDEWLMQNPVTPLQKEVVEAVLQEKIDEAKEEKKTTKKRTNKKKETK